MIIERMLWPIANTARLSKRISMASAPHLKEVIYPAVSILWRFADGVPHLVHIITQHLNQLGEGRLGLVSYDKQ